MKKMLVALATVALLSACSSKPAVPGVTSAAKTPAVSASTTERTASNAENDAYFLVEMRVTDHDNKPIPGTDSELLQQGRDVCNALDGGSTPDQVADSLEAKTGRSIAKVVLDVQNSVTWGCPKYNATGSIDIPEQDAKMQAGAK
jgi:hypothetical protein